jgi:hypothetical protein
MGGLNMGTAAIACPAAARPPLAGAAAELGLGFRDTGEANFLSMFANRSQNLKRQS